MKKQLVIMGGRGNGTVLAATVEDIIADGGDWEILGILDDNVPRGEAVDGYEVLGPLSDAPTLVRKGLYFHFGIQAPKKFIERFTILRELKIPSDRFPTFVHPSAVISRNVRLGPGVAVTPLVAIGRNAHIGAHVFLHTHAVLARDTFLADYAYLAPRATLGAGCIMQKGAYLGTSCTVIEYTTVGAWSVVGMGAAVTHDVPAHTVVAGVPARPIGLIEARWPYGDD